ncbi:hypothetical protein DAPPUDRAFT_259561 [Daphnia pulex]|uniref:Uncharacterized protein n=1 Tax=Daphnia pulex TaxID=6669 RepID=E9HHE9_DAPPU|nr:hypothetical protein DAPPUDRAFT_259561 [Daphnia pulex]|eukprot:EFX68851.1 hypothetical protein DAPPUDRAFT_259561 [Daphnia pulex]
MSVRKKQELVLLRKTLIHISEVWPDELNDAVQMSNFWTEMWIVERSLLTLFTTFMRVSVHAVREC